MYSCTSCNPCCRSIQCVGAVRGRESKHQSQWTGGNDRLNTYHKQIPYRAHTQSTEDDNEWRRVRVGVPIRRKERRRRVAWVSRSKVHSFNFFFVFCSFSYFFLGHFFFFIFCCLFGDGRVCVCAFQNWFEFFLAYESCVCAFVGLAGSSLSSSNE